MKLESVTIQNFRCFGPQPTTVRFSHGVTVLVGANGSGKTALLEGLTRVFGLTHEQRTIRRGDFYVAPGASRSDRSGKSLYIDIRLAFPELEADPTMHPSAAVPACFQHMAVDTPGQPPYCRLRLEAVWEDDGTVDGAIEEKLCWVTTDEEPPPDEAKTPIKPLERGFVQVHYVPAARDTSTLLTYATRTMARRLLRAVAWSDDARQEVQRAARLISDAMDTEGAIRTINSAIAQRWGEVYTAAIDANPVLSFMRTDLEEIMDRASVVFRPSEIGGEHDMRDLSDGQRSLFYFSLVAAVFDIEQQVLQQDIAPALHEEVPQPSEGVADQTYVTGFNRELLRAPVLTCFAVEEPENHLAPYFLSRIIALIQSVVSQQSAQAVFTSHSPAILGRIEPTDIRHFRLDDPSRSTLVHDIKLPLDYAEAAKYVREAVIAFPELYFARFVILSEGDSEQVVLPRIGAALNLEIDRSFVAVVPLGGRHINHFWRLLSDLEIPYATLLDLDLGREGGGWGRIKYVCEQLIARNESWREQLLTEQAGSDDTRTLTHEEFAELHKRDEIDIESLTAWIDKLERFDVFFSSPLDLDMLMLSHFEGQYQSTAHEGYGPRIPRDSEPTYESAISDAGKSVLGSGAGIDIYSSDELGQLRRLFPWYRYLFLGRSKPTTHLHALSRIDDGQLNTSCPSVLRKLLLRADSKVRSLGEQGQ